MIFIYHNHQLKVINTFYSSNEISEIKRDTNVVLVSI